MTFTLYFGFKYRIIDPGFCLAGKYEKIPAIVKYFFAIFFGYPIYAPRKSVPGNNFRGSAEDRLYFFAGVSSP